MDTVIISGANGNIGSSIAEELLKKGKNVVLLYNQSNQRIQPLAKQYPRQTLSVQCDIRNIGTLEPSLADALRANSWLPRSMIHAASLRSIDHKSLVESDLSVWKDVIDTNILGTYNLLKVTLRCFQDAKIETAFRNLSKKDPFCRIILFGSDVSRIGLPYGSAYAASKAAISNMCRSLSVELAKDMILINTISPGPVKIDDSHFPEDYKEFREKYYKMMLKQIPLGRLADTADITSLALFLISEENQYITGEEFFITGGKR